MNAVQHFLPYRAQIAEIIPESDDTRTFVLALDPPTSVFDASRPGQFAMLSLFGYGEAPFTLSSVACALAVPGTVTLTVRRVGTLTSALFALPQGALVGVRGPFGRGFPAPHAWEPTLYVAGGCGLAPLKPAIEHHLVARPTAPIAVLYGARDAEARIHRAALATWSATPGVHVIECVENGNAAWHGHVGTVGEFLNRAMQSIHPERAAICGPPAMLAHIGARLRDAGILPGRIAVALERYMKCGTGRCGHCYVNHRYVCTDGPVFTFAELSELPDAFPPTTDATMAAAC
jgi:NAD(P)H-flavin reductase